MKRIFAFLLLTALLLTGCVNREEPENTVTFYYPRTTVTYGSDDGVIAPESRELPAGNADLSGLLALYMKGPVDPSLRLPFPADTRLSDITWEDSTLTVTFSQELAGLDGIDLSIACACISCTCFSLTDAQAVRIEAPALNPEEDFSFTVTRDTFLLFDDTTTEADAS